MVATGPEWGEHPAMEEGAFDLSRLRLRVEQSGAHPNGSCTREDLLCRACRLPALIATRYGGPMAHCGMCGFGWAVDHHPERCWQSMPLYSDGSWQRLPF